MVVQTTALVPTTLVILLWWLTAPTTVLLFVRCWTLPLHKGCSSSARTRATFTVPISTAASTVAAAHSDSDLDCDNDNEPSFVDFNGTVTILDRGPYHVVVSKPPAVICHRSGFTGSSRRKRRTVRRKNSKPQNNSNNSNSNSNSNSKPPEVPMLQRVREAVGGEWVNLVHRLDRGASGCLLLAFANSPDNSNNSSSSNATAVLQASMATSRSLPPPTTTAISTTTTPPKNAEALAKHHNTKTYIALVRGEGILKGRDFTTEGWFEVSQPISNENGVIKNATSYFRFVAGQSNSSNSSSNSNGGGGDCHRPRASLVLCRIATGRWHQIRKHLRDLSHPIIGDSAHGNSKTNREWKEHWGLPPERTCLHLLELKIPPAAVVTPGGIRVLDPIPPDMAFMLTNHFSEEFLETTHRILQEEGLDLTATPETPPDVVDVSFSMPL